MNEAFIAFQIVGVIVNELISLSLSLSLSLSRIGRSSHDELYTGAWMTPNPLTI